MFRAKECAVPLVAKRETTSFYCYALSCSDGDNISGYELSVTCRVSFCALDSGLGWSGAFAMGNKYCRHGGREAYLRALFSLQKFIPEATSSNSTVNEFSSWLPAVSSSPITN